MRLWINREVTFGSARCRGFGIRFDWGCSGSTYGEPGRNMFLTIQIGVWRLLNINLTWKRP